MSGYSGYMFGFQAGFQVVYPNRLSPNGGRPKRDYQPTSHELRHIDRLNQISAVKLKKKVADEDFKATEIKIEALELQRLREGLEDRLLQEELMRLMLERQQIMLAIMAYDRMIAQLIDDDEAIFVILLSLS